MPNSPSARREADPARTARVDGWLTTWVCAASAALFLALAWPMLSGRLYGGDDLTAFHLPVRWFYWNALQHGHSFDWLPDIFCGFYLTGEGQAGTYHPFHLLLYRWAPFETAFNLEVWLSYPLMFAGMVLFLSRGPFGEAAGDANAAAGATTEAGLPGLPLAAALFGAMLFTFSSSCMLHFMHMNAIAVVAHLPWTLWAIDVAVRSRRPRERSLAFAAIALLTASQLLCGHPQYVWICFVGELAWLVLAVASAGEAEQARGGLRMACRVLLRFGLAKFVGALIGAIQLLPTIDHLVRSERLESATSIASHGSLHPLNLVQFFAPYLLPGRVTGSITHEYGLYAGAVPVVLCAWLFSRRGQLGSSSRPLLGVALIGAMALVLSLGGYGGSSQLLSLLPGIGEFRLPARYLVLAHLAIAVLAAAAVARIPSGGDVDRQDAWPHGWKLAVFTVALAVALRLLLPAGHVGPALGAAIGPVLFVLAIAVFTLVLRGSQVAVALMIVLAAADAGLYGFSYVAGTGSRTLESVLAGLPEPPPDAPRLATFQPDSAGKFLGNQWILRGWRLSDGYAGLLPPNRLDARTLAGLRASNVGFVLRRGENLPLEGLTVVDAGMAGVPDPLRRLTMATTAMVSASPGRDLLTLPPDSLATTVLVETAMPLEGPAGQARFVSDRPGNLEVAVHAPARQLLVIADRYHDGWRAMVNGTPAAVHRVNGDFMGVAVGAGESTVRLTFEPASLRYGKGVTLAGIAAWAVLLAAGIFRARTQDGESSPDRRPTSGRTLA